MLFGFRFCPSCSFLFSPLCPSMAASSSSTVLFFFLCVTAFSSLHLAASAPAPPCPHQSVLFLNSLHHRCPLSISPIPPIEVGGAFLDRVFLSKEIGDYTSVLFYASWCPFSHKVHSSFEILSSMFPQIEHLAVEQSSAMPSVYSRYGIHSLPSILIVNQTSRVRYHGPKNLNSLVQFYEKTTGLEPVQYIDEDQSKDSVDEKFTVKAWNQSSPKEIITREPYLVLSIAFLCLRMLISISPRVVSRVRAFWASYAPQFNMEIFGETSQIFGRVLDVVDVRRVWTKLRLCKTRNFHERAMNARAWASSLASVSLGESSSGRSSS